MKRRGLRSAISLTIALCLSSSLGFAQKDQGIYVDAKGVIRWKENNKEASFFGVNYTTPFAYGYRSHLALGIDPEKAIVQDVYHMSRLGLDAFRVHVWDTEITDSAGNLLQNEHLRLFDFLIAELKKRKIRTLVTPIAFWGNGYPERDEKTQGFSAKYGKGPSVVLEPAIKAQENYLKQFFNHVNPYTKLSYLNDPDIIATEINNEPHHSGPKEGAKDYINRLAAAIRSTGWTKPIFYNISESPWYADAVASSNIDGVSFQWYPTGLVANHTLMGNFLPNVDSYQIPFDTIPAYKNKARMVYEFDAGDVYQPVMYPAMARSFRTAGFQWATQFAYDPMATAYANTEYQTHYLNLAYSPAKAISLMIASRVFHDVSRLKSFGSYPANSKFLNFEINYKKSLSLMNSTEEFLYTGNTSAKPLAVSKLKRIAGVGSSALVDYKGSGAYFLDKVGDGIWRLELMPDAILIRDPFERASPRKEVTRIEWNNHTMQLTLSDLGSEFQIKGINEGNTFSSTASAGSFKVSPGTYLLLKKGKASGRFGPFSKLGTLSLGEFASPQSQSREVVVKHEPFQEVSAGKAFVINATVAGLREGAEVSLLINHLGGRSGTIKMESLSASTYRAEVPAEMQSPGLLNYQIVVNQAGDFTMFPGGYKEDPLQWDRYNSESWKTYVAASGSKLKIYDASVDHQIRLLPNWDENVKTAYLTSEKGSQLLYSTSSAKAGKDHTLGFQVFVGDKLAGRADEFASFKNLVITARCNTGSTGKIKVSLIDSEGRAFSSFADLGTSLSEIRLPLTSLKPDSALLLPRPYPGFQPLWFKPAGEAPNQLTDLEKLELSVGSHLNNKGSNTALGFEIESVVLEK